MRCERCQKREATVHLTVLLKPWAEPEVHHYCETCYPEVESPFFQSPAQNPVSPPFSGTPKQISAAQYLQAQRHAKASPEHLQAFQQLLNELGRLPKTCTRLAFDFLGLAREALERGEHPGFLVATSGSFWISAEHELRDEYAAELENLISGILERIGQPPKDNTESAKTAGSPLLWSLVFAMICLKRAAPLRYPAIAAELKKSDLLAQIEERMEQILENRE